jgi:hypothetical protein
MIIQLDDLVGSNRAFSLTGQLLKPIDQRRHAFSAWATTRQIEEKDQYE